MKTLLLLATICWVAWSGPIKPNRFAPGSHVGFISPASPYEYEVSNATQYLTQLRQYMNTNFGLISVFGPHMSEIDGYLAGPDVDRAYDVNLFFSNSSIAGMVSNRGGFGCGRMLDMVDFEQILSNPKIIVGYSDVTALILAIYVQTGLVTFHGPMGISDWSLRDNSYYFQQVLFNSQNFLFVNPPDYEGTITTFVPGKAKGKLIGGNLSVFVSILGTKYLPITLDWENYILFLEDVNEEPYQIDRMLTTIQLFGIFDRIQGFIWGTCSKCEAANPQQSWTLDQVLQSHLSSLSIPSFGGFMVGHIDRQFTLPIGIAVEMDSRAGSLQMLEPAVL